MGEKTLELFVERNAKPINLCSHYSEYSEEVQESLKKIYAACFRFGLYKQQTLYVLDEALTPFKRKKKQKNV